MEFFKAGADVLPRLSCLPNSFKIECPDCSQVGLWKREEKIVLWNGGFEFYFLVIRIPVSRINIIRSVSVFSWEQLEGGVSARRVPLFVLPRVEGQGKP